MPAETPHRPRTGTPLQHSVRRNQLADAIARATADRQLLSHAFYRQWQSGGLTPDQLGRYAVQYREFESALPEFLADVVTHLDEPAQAGAAELVAQNLRDELGAPEPHLRLFDRFAASLPRTAHDVTPATSELVDTYRDLARRGPIPALSALAAYETQAAAIAWSKGSGLREWYGLDRAATVFWDVHAEMEHDHGDWTIDALSLLEPDPEAVEAIGRQGAQLWWNFLDERAAEGGLFMECPPSA
jgi:pyrroloquinoline quinone (PQQ) biosynthesis protein C